jgi:hypothetical protein
MRKLLLAATMMALAAAPAFAGGAPRQPVMAVGSAAGVMSTQTNNANAKVGGSGAVIVGSVSGNYTTITTTGHAAAGQYGATTKATATQTNVGGTLAGGYSHVNRGRGNIATGSASGSQSSGDIGGSFASVGVQKVTAGIGPE